MKSPFLTGAVGDPRSRSGTILNPFPIFTFPWLFFLPSPSDSWEKAFRICRDKAGGSFGLRAISGGTSPQGDDRAESPVSEGAV